MLDFGGLKLHKCIHTFAVYMYVPASLFDNETPPHCTAAMDCLIFSCSMYYKNYPFICFQFNSELFPSKYANKHVCMWTLTAWNKYYYSLECAEITNLYNTQKYTGGLRIMRTLGL